MNTAQANFLFFMQQVVFVERKSLKGTGATVASRVLFPISRSRGGKMRNTKSIKLEMLLEGNI